MDEAHNRLLLDPPRDALAAALAAAGGARPRPALLDEIASRREGRWQLDGASAAWWTDRLGRKLVRVCGAAGRHHSRMDEDPRPPLWHVGPARVYRVRRPGGEPRWLACCACGEVGLPEEIAWTGVRCGGCHDKREEGLAVEEPPGLVEVGRAIHGLAFVEGGRLAVSSEGRQLELLHSTGEGEELYVGAEPGDDWEQLRPLAATEDGRWLAAVDPQAEVVWLWRLGPDEREAQVPLAMIDAEIEEPALGLAFAPDGRFLAMCQPGGRVMIWERAGDRWEVYRDLNTAPDRDGPATSIAFLHGHPGLAVGRRSGVVTFLELGHDRRSGRVRVAGREEVAYLAQPPDGRHLVVLTYPDEGDPARTMMTVPLRGTLRLWGFAAQSEVHAHDLLPPSLVAMSPAGRHLAWVMHHPERSPAEVVFWDVEQWRGAGSLEWDSEDVLTALAFSPGGDEVATGSASGAVKWCPWRRLLGG